MIQDDAQLERTKEALTHLERAMAALHRDRASIHPDRLALMAEPILEDLRRLRAEIDEYIGVFAAVQAEAPLWLRLRGPGIELHDAPTSVVTALIDLLRVGIQTVAEYIERGALSARPTALLRQSCDLRIVAWAPGSIQVGLRLPDVLPALYPEMNLENPASKALGLYLRAAAWTGSDEELAGLERDVPDSEQRRLILNQVARLIPRPRGALEVVELSGRALPRGPARLRRESRIRVRSAIDRIIQEERMTEEGVLREIDLDQRTFIVRQLEGDREARCAISTDADDLLAIAKDSLDYRVVVVGTRKKDPTRRNAFPLQVREIEVLGRDEEQSANHDLAVPSGAQFPDK
ncbi:MAG: hypothetical protein K2R98_29615 [Gemmataceae bacterium]|nr:hypothetical protein [Gemmataceae bacterium]